MIDRREIHRILNLLWLPHGCVIAGGASMVEYGIKKTTKDIDLSLDEGAYTCLESLWNRSNGLLWINIEGIQIEAKNEGTEYWGSLKNSNDYTELRIHPLYIGGSLHLRFLRPQAVMQWKLDTGEAKHLSDAKLIKDFLNNLSTNKDKK